MNAITNLTRQPREYELVWRKLRQDKRVVLEIVHEAFVPRIKRMISKEKDMDLGFKIINELERYRLRFSWRPERKELEIRLVAKYGIVETRG